MRLDQPKLPTKATQHGSWKAVAFVLSASVVLGCKTRLTEEPGDRADDGGTTLPCPTMHAAPVWATPSGDNQWTRHSPFVGPSDLSVVWRSVRLPEQILVVLVADAKGVVYLVIDGTLRALDAADGTLSFSIDLGVAVHVRMFPVVSLGDDGTAYVTFLGTPLLIAVDLERRKVRWRYTAPRNLDSESLVDGDTVYVGRAPLRAFRSCDGAIRWQIDGDLGALSSQGEIVASNLLVVEALAPSDGHRLWSSSTGPSDLPSTACCVVGPDGVVYASNSDWTPVDGTFNGRGTRFRLRALDPTDGHLRWARDFAGNPYGRELPVIGAESLLVTSETALTALDPADGHPLWRLPLAAAAGGDLLTYVTTDGAGTIYAMGSLDHGPRHLIVIHPDGTVAKEVDATDLGWCDVVVPGRLYCTRHVDGGIEVVAVGR